MVDRRLVGDVAIAVLLAVPTIALSRPQPTVADNEAVSALYVDHAAYADRTSVEKLTGLPR